MLANRGRRIILSVMIVCSVLWTPMALVQASPLIESVQVQVSSQEKPLPSRIAKRMSASVATIAEHVLVGRDSNTINENHHSYERLIQEVFERVLIGYAVENVQVSADAVARVDVVVRPWGDVVENVTLQLDLSSYTPEQAALIQRDLGDLEGKLQAVLLGLPVDAIDWAGGVAKLMVRDLLEDRLPEFRPTFEITPGVQTYIKLNLLPNGATVQNVHVTLKSQTIPNLLLAKARPTVEEAGNTLRGLPIDFVARHRAELTQRIAVTAAEHPLTKAYALRTAPVIYPANDTEIALQVETDRYRLWVEGYLDMGRKTDSTSVKVHTGRLLGARDELFMDTTFIPGSMVWRFTPGWEHRVGNDTMVGLKYQLNHRSTTLTLRQQLGNGWSIRAERTPETGFNEIGLRYKLHDFLSAEYVVTNDEHWLRLVGNL